MEAAERSSYDLVSSDSVVYIVMVDNDTEYYSLIMMSSDFPCYSSKLLFSK